MSTKDLQQFLSQALAAQTQAGLLRSRQSIEHNTDGVIGSAQAHYLDFASNDYLGLRHHHDVLQAWVNGLAKYGGGSGASPLVTGYYEAHKQLEALVAQSLNREAAIVFNSGFAANQALCRALFRSGGLIVADKLIHASFIEGALASKASFKRYRHNDINSLEQLLEQHVHSAEFENLPKLIATEGVFSMDGDVPPMQEIVTLAEQYGFDLMLDEAHAIGVIGDKGLGSTSQYKLTQQQVPIIMGTFGKAIATGGAFIAGSQVLIDYLVNFAKEYIYSTAMPPAQAEATTVAWSVMLEGSAQQKLQQNIIYFKQVCERHSIATMPSNSAIQLIPLGDPKRTTMIGGELRNLGMWVGVMRSPTVPKGTDRLRITLRANHSQQDIDALVDALDICLRKESVS